ncbi:MAG: hypothetical protein ACOY5S_03130 [Pseudomonadota bacterium]
MKLNQIALAVAATCVAAPSFALTPAQIDGTTVQLWLSGATAPTASVYKAVSALCQDVDGVPGPDDLHTYLSGNTSGANAVPGKSAAGKFAAYACTMGPLAGSLDGVKTVVYHTFDAGSFEAYTPHLYLAGEVHPLVPATLKRLKAITDPASTCTLLTGASDPANTYVNCGNVSVTLAPNVDQYRTPTLPVGGYSDTEYTLNQLNLGISKSLSDIGTEAPTNIGQGFGLAVSHPLYAELQKAQGIINTTAADGEACDGVYAAGACQPTINRQKYSSLVSANGVSNKDGSLFGAAAGSVIKVERRVGTSGTQSASNAFFLNTPCSTGLPLGGLTPAGTNTAGTTSYNGGKVLVRSNNGSGDVKAQLSAASTAGELAIGVLSLENVPSAAEKFAFVKLNGVSPNVDAKQRQTAIDGDYEFWYELVAFTASSAPAEGADLINGTVAALGDPSITDLTGLFVTKAAGVSGANVSKGAKVGNACAPAVQ